MKFMIGAVLFVALVIGEAQCDPKKEVEDNQKASDNVRNNYVSGGQYRQRYVGEGGYNTGYRPVDMGLGGGRYGSGYNTRYGGYGTGYNNRYGGYGGYGGQGGYGNYGYNRQGGRYGGYYGNSDGRYYDDRYGAGRYPYNTGGYNMPYNTAYRGGYGAGRHQMGYGSYGYGYNRQPQELGYGQYGYEGAYDGYAGQAPYAGYRREYGRSYSQVGAPGVGTYGRVGATGALGYEMHRHADSFHDSYGGANVHAGGQRYQFSTSHTMPAAPQK